MEIPANLSFILGEECGLGELRHKGDPCRAGGTAELGGRTTWWPGWPGAPEPPGPPGPLCTLTRLPKRPPGKGLAVREVRRLATVSGRRAGGVM